MKAIVSVYKSDAVAYMKEMGLKREDVYLICSNAEIEPNKERFDEVILLSAPMGVPNNQEYLNGVLLKKAPPPPPKKEEKVQVEATTPAPEVAKAPAKKPAAKKPSPKAKPDAKG